MRPREREIDQELLQRGGDDVLDVVVVEHEAYTRF